MKIKGPLLSVGASGSVGNILTFSKRKTHQHARNKQGANKKLTPAQAEWRLLFDFVSLKWQSLTDDEKNVYRNLGKELNPSLTGFQYLAKIGMSNPKDYLDIASFYPLMNISSSNTFLDYSGNELHLTISGNTSLTMQMSRYNTPKNRWRVNKLSQEVETYSPAATNLNLIYNEITISFLVKVSQFTDTNFFIYNYYFGTPRKGIAIKLDTRGFQVDMYYDGAQQTKILEVSNIFTRGFFYASIVWEDDKVKLYLDGEFANEEIVKEFDPNGMQRTYVMHKYTSGDTALTTLNNVSILKRNLSSSECLFLYKALKLNETYE